MHRSDIALQDAILIYVACVLNEATLTPDGCAEARKCAIAEVEAFLDNVPRSGQLNVPAGALRKPRRDAEWLSLVGSTAKELVDDPEAGVEALANYAKGLGISAATFPRMERWKRLQLHYRSCRNELLEAHHRGDLKLSGSKIPEAPSTSRRKIPPAFTFQSPSEKRRVEFDGRTLSKVIAPGPESQFRAGWSTVEAWYEVRTPAASLIELISKKLRLNTSAARYNLCLEFLLNEGEAETPPPKEELLKTAKSLFKDLKVNDVFEPAWSEASQQRPNLRKSGPRKSRSKNPAP
jgi:hypothetical protein